MIETKVIRLLSRAEGFQRIHPYGVDHVRARTYLEEARALVVDDPVLSRDLQVVFSLCREEVDAVEGQASVVILKGLKVLEDRVGGLTDDSRVKELVEALREAEREHGQDEARVLMASEGYGVYLDDAWS